LTAREQHLELFDVALRDDAGIAFLEFALGVELIRSLLIGALCFRDLPVGFQDVRLRGRKAASTSAILRRALSMAASCLELSSLKITSPFLTGALNST